MEKEKELWDQIEKNSQLKAENKRIRGNLLADLAEKTNMVEEFMKKDQETTIELERVKEELIEEKQKRGREIVALEKVRKELVEEKQKKR